MRLGIAILGMWLSLGSAAQEPAAVPFQLIDGWAIVLEGTLGGMPQQKVLIDTGSVPSAINIKLARRLGLSGPVQKLSVMNRAFGAERVRVPGVQVGAIAVDVLDMVALDLTAIEQALGTRIDAIIGLDLLARHEFSLDYRRKKLVFVGMDDPAGAITFETKHEGSGIYILIPVQIEGEKLEMLLDTGTKDLMLFERLLRGSLQQLRIRAQDFNLNAGGKDRLAEVELQSVGVGPIARRKQKAYIWSTPGDNLRAFDGLLGPAALGASVVAFDFDQHKVSLKTH